MINRAFINLAGCLLFAGSHSVYSSTIDLQEPPIKRTTFISCISQETSAQAQVKQSNPNNNRRKASEFFTQWFFGENKNPTQSNVSLRWTPHANGEPSVDIITNDKSHNLIALRSHTKESLIIVSSASNPYTTESWTFAVNFNLESMIATRVQSNVSGLRGEVLNYNCSFTEEEPTRIDPSNKNVG